MIGEVRLPAKAKVIVVGGGIQGLSVAYNLARLGERDVVVLDAGYFQGGASGRNGTLIRGGFMSDAWTALFALSNRRWIELSKRLQRNVMFSRRGYLLVAERPETAARFEPALLMHAKHGVQSKRLSSRELYRIAPALNRNAGLEAIFLPEGGVSPHHAAMHGYLEACHELGVRVHYGTPITHITARGSHIEGVVASGRDIRADHLVIAAGAASVAVAGLAGAELPGFPMRIECMALEPTRSILRPAIAFIDRLCYVSQTARGEVVGGAEVAESPKASLACDLPAMAATAKVYRDMLPCLAQLRILRHWAGLIHATQDFGPLLGAHPEYTNMWVTAGWSYGFASAPAVGELLAHTILSGTTHELLQPFSVDRFRRHAPVIEAGIVLAAHA
jgi:heterotetrameric sarcosine oxidase beta subunit